MEGKIFAVIVPTEKKIKIKAGKRSEEDEKIYPGYVPGRHGRDRRQLVRGP